MHCKILFLPTPCKWKITRRETVVPATYAETLTSGKVFIIYPVLGKEIYMRKAIFALFFVMALVMGKSIVLTLDAPDTGISGLAWGDGKLWAVDETTDYVHSINPETGEILSTFYVAHSSTYFPTGLAYSETHNMVLVGLWNNGTTGYVYKYSPDGTYLGQVDMCGG